MKFYVQNGSKITNAAVPIIIVLMLAGFIIGGVYGLYANIRERIELAKEYKDYEVVTGEVTKIHKHYDEENNLRAYSADIECSIGMSRRYFNTGEIFEERPRKSVKVLVNNQEAVVATKDIITFKYIPLNQKRDKKLFASGVCLFAAMLIVAATSGNETFIKLGISSNLILLGVLGVGCGIAGFIPGFFMIPFGICGILAVRKFYFLTPEQIEEENRRIKVEHDRREREGKLGKE